MAPRRCVVCKRDTILGDRTRSLHQFPTSEESRQAWMTVLGLQKHSKQYRVCSDHFDASDFSEGTAAVRRLKSTAVPRQKLSGQEVIYLVDDGIQQNGNIIEDSDSEDSHELDQSSHDSFSLSNSLFVSMEGQVAMSAGELPVNNILVPTDSVWVKEEVDLNCDGGNSDSSKNKKNVKRKQGSNTVTVPTHSHSPNEVPGHCTIVGSSDASHSDNDSDEDLKREFTTEDGVQFLSDVRLRVIHGNKWTEFCRDNFVSPRKWQDFKLVMEYLHKEIQSERQKACKYRKQAALR